MRKLLPLINRYQDLSFANESISVRLRLEYSLERGIYSRLKLQLLSKIKTMLYDAKPFSLLANDKKEAA